MDRGAIVVIGAISVLTLGAATENRVIGEVMFFGIAPTMLLVTLILRESGNSSWIRDHRKAILIVSFMVSMIGASNLMAARELRSEAMLKAFGWGVYATIGLYFLYLTYWFAVRVRHFYRLPNLTKSHRDSTGALDVEQVIRDAPIPNEARAQKAWVSRNQALRAAQALADLKGEEAHHLPPFLPQDPSQVKGARALLQAYTDYLFGVRDAVVKAAVDKALRDHQQRA